MNMKKRTMFVIAGVVLLVFCVFYFLDSQLLSLRAVEVFKSYRQELDECNSVHHCVYVELKYSKIYGAQGYEDYLNDLLKKLKAEYEPPLLFKLSPWSTNRLIFPHLGRLVIEKVVRKGDRVIIDYTVSKQNDPMAYGKVTMLKTGWSWKIENEWEDYRGVNTDKDTLFREIGGVVKKRSYFWPRDKF